MKNILISSVHPTMFTLQVEYLLSLGYNLFTPAAPEDNQFGYGHSHMDLAPFMPPHLLYKVVPLTLKEIPKASIDLIWCGAHLQLAGAKEILINLGLDNKSPKLLLYSCNTNSPYTAKDGTFLLAEDLDTFVRSTVPIKQHLYFPINYLDFRPQPFMFNVTEEVLRIVTLIQDYEKLFPTEYADYCALKKYFAGQFNFIILSDAPRQTVIEELQKGAALLHLKPHEASGYAMMEALACGVPVIVYEDFPQGRSCSHFLINKFNSIFLRRNSLATDFESHVRLENLIRLKRNASTSIRELVTKTRTLNILDEFLWRIKTYGS